MISDNIRKLMAQRSIRSVNELATRAKMPQATLWHIMSEETKNPSSKILQKLAGALGVTIDDLLKESTAAYPTTDELRGAPGADAMFAKNGFYDRMTPEDKKMLETFLQGLKARYK